jgi:hypothetical protein
MEQGVILQMRCQKVAEMFDTRDVKYQVKGDQQKETDCSTHQHARGRRSMHLRPELNVTTAPPLTLFPLV